MALLSDALLSDYSESQSLERRGNRRSGRILRLYSAQETLLEFSVAVIVVCCSFVVSILARNIQLQDRGVLY